MTFFLVAVALYARAGRVGPTHRRQSRSRFFRAPLCQNPQTAGVVGKIQAEPVYHGDCQEKRRLCQNRRAALGKFEAELVYYGDFLMKKRRSRQIPRLLIAGLGKTIWNSFIMAIFPRKSGGYAKNGDSRAAWENFSGTRLSWRSPRKAPWDRRTIRMSEAIWIGGPMRIGEAADACPIPFSKFRTTFVTSLFPIERGIARISR